MLDLGRLPVAFFLVKNCQARVKELEIGSGGRGTELLERYCIV